jgi:PleD family two-component response regulator
VNLFLSSQNNRINYYSSNDRSSIRREKEDTNRGDNDKPIAKLLIVDDDPDIVHVLKLGLLKNGFLVTAFTNPEDALQSFKSNAEAYCLVLSDIRMPGLSGIQLAKKVRD